MEEVIFINGIEQINIGTIEKPYHIPKPTEEMKKLYAQIYLKNFKQNKTK